MARIRALSRVALAALTWLGWSCIHPAHASVSIPLTFDDLILRASAVAVVTSDERQGIWEDGRIATYTHVHVDRLIAGKLPTEVSVRTQGGAVGHIGQLVEGEAAFTAGKASLVFLHPHDGHSATPTFGVVEGAQGQFPIETDGRSIQRLLASPHMGALVPSPSTHPLARDVLVNVPLEAAANAIATAWARQHPASGDKP